MIQYRGANSFIKIKGAFSLRDEVPPAPHLAPLKTLNYIKKGAKMVVLEAFGNYSRE